jgi:hypothetical protein
MLLLMLLLLFSQVVMTAHATQHESLKLDPCHLCTGQAQPLDADFTTHELFAVICDPAAARYLPVACLVKKFFVASRNQRAPPVHS